MTARTGRRPIKLSPPPWQAVYTMASCKNKLYVVASNVYGKYELWEYDERTWTKIIGKDCPTPENFGSTDNFNISTMAGYKGKLYLGVTNNQTGFKVFQSSFPEISPPLETAAVNTVELLTIVGRRAAVKMDLIQSGGCHHRSRAPDFSKRLPREPALLRQPMSAALPLRHGRSRSRRARRRKKMPFLFLPSAPRPLLPMTAPCR